MSEFIANPSYGVFGNPEMELGGSRPPGFVAETAANWRRMGTIQWLERKIEQSHEPDPKFNPWDHLEGYERFAGDLILSKSQPEMDAFKSRIDRNMRDDKMLANGEWGLVSALVAGIGDPLNLIPIPIFKGIGMVKGAAAFGATTAGFAVASEGIRLTVDPTMEPGDIVHSIGPAFLLGAVLGGAVGSIGARQYREARAATERFSEGLTSAEKTNVAAVVKAHDEGFNIIPEKPTGIYDDAGRKVPIAITAIDTPIGRKTGPDGKNYVIDEGTDNWILESEKGKPFNERTDIGEDIKEALGRPETEVKKTILRDDDHLINEFESGDWVNNTGEGFHLLDPEQFKGSQDWVTFRTLRELQKDAFPIRKAESLDDYNLRMNDRAIKELDARRVTHSIARAMGIENLLQALNRSPVAKAIRVYMNDNYLTDAPLRIAGDYGWAVRSNHFGYRTPPSVLMKALEHRQIYGKFKAAFDIQWTLFNDRKRNVTSNQREILSMNWPATLFKLRAEKDKLLGRDVVTQKDFADMVGEAVFNKSDTAEVRGHPIPPEAREVAKAYTSMMQNYDDAARGLGIFEDQKSLKDDISKSQYRLKNTESTLAKWLWSTSEKTGETKFIEVKTKVARQPENGSEFLPNEPQFDTVVTQEEVPVYGTAIESETPIALKAAIKIDDVVYTGTTLKEAAADAVTKLTDEGKTQQQIDEIMDGLGDDAAGWIDPAKGDASYKSNTELIKGRKASMSKGQNEWIGRLDDQIDDLKASIEEAELRLKDTNDNPHSFLDANGNPESYLSRFMDRMGMAANREKVNYLFAKWFERDRIVGADERAAKSVDDIINGVNDFDPDLPRKGGAGTLGHLKKRPLSIPNSWKVTHPEWGEIKMSDYIDTNILAIAETYTRRMGAKIETARMFGDANMTHHIRDLKTHIIEKYVATSDNPAGELARMDEYINHLQNTRDMTLGNFRETDPWRIDNVWARRIKNMTILATMGRAVLTSIPEMMRPGMVGGFGNFFQSNYTRMLGDLDQLAPTEAFKKLHGELIDMALDQNNARLVDQQMGESTMGGKWFDRALQERIPGFFKFTLLTPLTVMTKDWMANTALHVIMKEVVDVSDTIKLGQTPNQKTIMRLSALGISERDAARMAKMAFETTENGTILPAVDQWTGSEGTQMKNLLLSAMTGEMRRAITTPSVADKSTIFSGVLTDRGGKKVFETELMALPVQFLSFALGAHQKVFTSMLQGRDRSSVMGMFTMLGMGVLANWLKTPENAWRNKEYEDILLDGYEAAGVTGYWFGDLNNSIERYSSYTLGLRPLLGMDPKYGKNTEVDNYVDALGAGPSTFYDFARAFNPASDLANTKRAQMIRRAIPYNNVLYWGNIFRNMATSVGEATE